MDICDILLRGFMESYEEHTTEKYDLVVMQPFSIVYEGLTKEEADAKIQAIQDLAVGSNKPNLMVSWQLLDKDGNHVTLGENYVML